MVRLTLVSRGYCHLCTEMLEALVPLQAAWGFELDVVDVDSDERLLAQYDELVPVLLAGQGEICHYHLDAEALVSHLKTAGLSVDAKRLESRP